MRLSGLFFSCASLWFSDIISGNMDTIFRPEPRIFQSFITRFWYAPQDVLQRTAEASIFHKLAFKHPVLEVGTGDASIADIFFPKKLIIDIGSDLDAEGIARAKGNRKYKKLAVENAEKLTLPNGKYMTVICNSTAEHIVNDSKAVKEMGRVLKRGGMLYLTVPSEYLPKMVQEFERFEGNTNPKKAVKQFNQRLQHKHYRSLADWKKLLKAGGMEIVESRNYFPETTARAWYFSLKFSTTKMFGREMWSWLGQSRLTDLMPKNLVIWYLANLKLKSAFAHSLDATDEGAMLFIAARKK